MIQCAAFDSATHKRCTRPAVQAVEKYTDRPPTPLCGHHMTLREQTGYGPVYNIVHLPVES